MVALLASPSARWLVTILAIGTVVSFLHIFWFVLVPGKLSDWLIGNDKKRRQKLLEFIAASPSLAGRGVKVYVWLRLLPIYLTQERYADVSRLCHAMLQEKLPPGLESEARYRLADALDGQGLTAEGAVERQRAEACLAGGPEDLLSVLNRAKLLETKDRHEEAYELYQRALALAPVEKNIGVHTEVLTHLVLSAFHTGRQPECAQWAERAVAAGASGMNLRAVHRMASVAYRNMGDLARATEHANGAYQQALREGDSKGAAECLGDLAEIKRKQGDLVGAFAACQQLLKDYPDHSRHTLLIQFETLYNWGRFEESLEALHRSRSVGKLFVPRAEKRSQAVFDLGEVRLNLELGRVEEAWTFLQTALAELGNDPKLGIACDSMAARCFVARGDHERALKAMELAESKLPQFSQDRSTTTGALTALGRASLALDDPKRALGYWTRHQEQKPDPVAQPMVDYFLGECERQLGHNEAAIASYRRAISTKIDTYCSRLARQRLRELAGELV